MTPQFTDVATLKANYLKQEKEVANEWLAMLLEEMEGIFALGANRWFTPWPDLVPTGLTTALAGANNDLRFTAAKAVATIAYNADDADQDLAVAVSGNDVVVELETNGTGDPVSTALEVRSAVNASAAAITAEVPAGNDGSGVVTALAETAIPTTEADTADPVLRRLSTGGRPGTDARYQIAVPVPDLREVDSVVVAGTEVAPSSAPGVYPLDGYELVYQRPREPATGILLPLTCIPCSDWGEGDLAITGRWGFLEPPGAVKGAIYLMAARAVRERAAGYSETVETEAGVVSYFRTMPARAWTTFNLYKRRSLT